MQASWNEAAGFDYLQLDPETEATEIPLFICLHGRGADPSDLAGLAFELEPEGYRWVLPKGQIPLPMGPGMLGWAWYSIDDDRAAALPKAREGLRAFVNEVLTKLNQRRSQTLIMGFSQGAAMSLHVGLTSPEPFAGIGVMSGYLPAPETLPNLNVAPPQPILMVHGTDDQTLKIEQAREARARLEAAGLLPRYQELPMDHQITSESLAVVRDFMIQVLPPARVAS